MQLPPYGGAVLCGAQAAAELPNGKPVLSFIPWRVCWVGRLPGSGVLLSVHTFWINIPLLLDVFAVSYSRFNHRTTLTNELKFILCFRVPDVQRGVKEIVAHFCFFLTVLSDTDIYSFIAKALCKGSEVSFLSGCAGCWVQSWRFSEHVLSAWFSGSFGLLSCSLCLCPRLSPRLLGIQVTSSPLGLLLIDWLPLSQTLSW